MSDVIFPVRVHIHREHGVSDEAMDIAVSKIKQDVENAIGNISGVFMDEANDV